MSDSQDKDNPQAKAQGGPPPPYPGPPTHQPGHVIVINTPPMIVVGPEPTRTICPFCHAEVVTLVHRRPGSMAWIACIVMCLVGLWPCSCIPFCMDSCHESIHICPNCGRLIGCYRV